MPKIIWNKPVICIFKERDDPEIDPFVVVKAKKISISQSASGKFDGEIQDFFTLMGDADYLTTSDGIGDHFVICWFDDTEPDMTRDLRRLRGVTLAAKATCAINKADKRTYNVAFRADHAKLK